MIFGFNTDVDGKDGTYHVQTEDRGEKNPIIDSIVYVGGKIVDRVQTPYEPDRTSQDQIAALVRSQHKELVESIRAGSFVVSKQASKKEPALDPAPAATIGYTIRLINQQDITRDGNFQFDFSVWSRARIAPAADVLLDARWLGEDSEVQSASARTDGDGKATVWFPVPRQGSETALVVCVAGPDGREIVKYQIRSSGRVDYDQTDGGAPQRRETDRP